MLDLVNRAVIPGAQGGPLLHMMASKAAQAEWLKSKDAHETFHQLQKNRDAFAKVLSDAMASHAFSEDGYWIRLGLEDYPLNSRALAQEALSSVGIDTHDATFVEQPGDREIRIGLLPLTMRGFREEDFSKFGQLIVRVLNAADPQTSQLSENIRAEITDEVKTLAAKHPVHQELLAQINQAGKTSDAAMLTIQPSSPTGGIDITQVESAVQIQRDGNGVPLPLPLQSLQNINLNLKGFVPNIIYFGPMPNLPQLLGFTLPGRKEENVPKTKTTAFKKI